MKAKRASLCQGKGSLSHNLRLFTANNVDRTRTRDNIVFVNIPQQEMYERLFDGAVSEYNAKQKRNDRKITVSYYEHQFGRKYSPNVVTSADKRNSFYEDVVQVGDMNDTGVGTFDAEIAKAVLTEYINGFEKRNPNFKVFCAVLHVDEATPHLHIDYIPIGHYTRGIPVQNGIAQALYEMGYGTGKNAIARWRQSEYEVLKGICAMNDIELLPPKKSVGSKSVELYKEEKRLEEKIGKLREMEIVAEETTIIGKKQLLSHNISVSPEEFEQLEVQKKAVAVQIIDNQNEHSNIEQRIKELDRREAYIADLEKESLSRQKERSKELDKREHDIVLSENRAEQHMSYAKQKMATADRIYNEQLELNQRYDSLETNLRDVTDERNELYCKMRHIRQALGISYSDDKTDPEEKIKSIKEENWAIDQLLNDELRLPWSQMKNTTPIEMLHMLIDRFKNRFAEADKELSESRAIIGRLTDLKQSFIKVVLAVNTLVCSEKYSSGLTGISNALATGISLFTDECFKKLGEYDTINKCVLDDKIRENMNHFIEPERTKNNYYER